MSQEKLISPPSFKSPHAAVVLQLREIWRAKRLIWLLLGKDAKASFRQRLLGYFWVIFTPFLAVTSYLVLNASGLLNSGTPSEPYILHVLAGSTMWSCISAAVGIMALSFEQQADLVTKSSAPRIAVMLGSLATYGIGIMGSLAMLAVVSLLMKAPVAPAFVMAPLLILPLILIGIGFGLVISVLNTIARDFGVLATQIIVLAMFTVPSVTTFEVADGTLLGKIYSLNPLTYLIEFPRALILNGPIKFASEYLLSVGGAIVFFLGCIWIFDVTSDLVVDRI